MKTMKKNYLGILELKCTDSKMKKIIGWVYEKIEYVRR